MLLFLICTRVGQWAAIFTAPIKRLSCLADFSPFLLARSTVEDGNFTHEGPLERPHRELVFSLAPPSDG